MSEYKIEDRTIPVDNGEILVRCVLPTPSGEGGIGPYPLFVWYHGGGNIPTWLELYHLSKLRRIGYCVGSADYDDYILRELSVKYRIVIVNVEYRYVFRTATTPTCISDEPNLRGLSGWHQSTLSLLALTMAMKPLNGYLYSPSET